MVDDPSTFAVLAHLLAAAAAGGRKAEAELQKHGTRCVCPVCWDEFLRRNGTPVMFPDRIEIPATRAALMKIVVSACARQTLQTNDGFRESHGLIEGFSIRRFNQSKKFRRIYRRLWLTEQKLS